MKKLVIFESCKGAGKTTLTNELINIYPNSRLLSEDDTTRGVIHNNDFNYIENFYKNILEDIRNSEKEIFFLDRFHGTKWPVEEYDKNYFENLEKILIEEFDTYLIFLEIKSEKILERLIQTQEYRAPFGWKLNHDGVGIEEEAEKDVNWQKGFLEKPFKDSVIKNKLILDTTELNKDVNDVNSYVNKIINFIL